MSLVWRLVLTTADGVPGVVAVALLAMLVAAAHDAWRRRGNGDTHIRLP